MTIQECEQFLAHATIGDICNKQAEIRHETITNLHLTNEEIKHNNRLIAMMDEVINEVDGWL